MAMPDSVQPDPASRHLEAGAIPVIPPNLNRRNYNKERNRIERFFKKLKHFRRVATRRDKLLVDFPGFVTIAIHLR